MPYLSETGNKQAIHLQHLLEFIQSPALRIESCQDFIMETIQHSNHFLFRKFSFQNHAPQNLRNLRNFWKIA